MSLSFRRLASLCCFVLPVVAGCGVSTGLDLYDDADLVRRDGGLLPRDGGRDAGRDAGRISCGSSAECNDGLVCNGEEVCIGGACSPGRPVLCDDGVGCTDDACSEPGMCTSRPDDSRCDFGLRCDPFRDCVPVTSGCMGDFECDDGDLCNGAEICAGGTCITGSPFVCPADTIACTIESCDSTFGCVSVADSRLCAIGEVCRPMLGCLRVACMSDFDCNDGDPCNGTERCIPTTATCAPGLPPSCDDGSACTTDRCVPFSGCTSTTELERCADLRDNDCNGLVDCADPFCFGRPECGCSFDEARCNDGRDEDCDGFADCTDPSCSGRDGCPFCTPDEPFERTCFDGRDNDCNGFLDCTDFNCTGDPFCGGCTPIADRELFCFDGRDDDCDGFFDCSDMECVVTPECGGCMPTGPFETSCFDGIDNDCDNFFDCGDPDCRMTMGCGCFPTSSTEIRCRDAIDDDCDGAVDCSDSDCVTRPFCMGACMPTGTRELGIDDCTDGLDNDCDSRRDCLDPDCTPFGPMGECCNGVDDNFDGSIDEFTCRCFSDGECFGVGTYEQVCWDASYSVCAPDCRLYGGNVWCRMFLPDTPTCSSTTGECI